MSSKNTKHFLNNSNQIETEIITEKSQNNFLESTLGKTINAAVDLGLRWVLPDLVEDEIINIKNGLIKGGLKEGINTVIVGKPNAGVGLLAGW